MLGAVLSSEASLARESEASCWVPITSAEDPAVLSGVRVRFLIVAPFVHTPYQESRDLSEDMNPKS